MFNNKNTLLLHYYKLFLAIPEKIRFIFIGGINTILGYIYFSLFYHLFHNNLHYQNILFFSFILNSITSFIFLKLFVFCTKGRHFKEYIKTLISYAILFGINIILLYVFIENLNLNAYSGQAISVILLAIISYILHKYFSFRTN